MNTIIQKDNWLISSFLENRNFVFNKDKILKDSSSTMFNFNVINPVDEQDKCLQLNNDGLSVMPCSLDLSQRFRESYFTVLP